MSLPPEFLETCQGQRILIIEPFSWTPHVETGLELAEILSQNNKVHYVGPDVLRCFTDETARARARIQNKLTRKHALSKYVSPDARSYSRQEIVALERSLEAPDLRPFDTTRSDFQALKFENVDVGMGVVSSLITLTRNVHFDRAKYRDVGAALARD